KLILGNTNLDESELILFEKVCKRIAELIKAADTPDKAIRYSYPLFCVVGGFAFIYGGIYAKELYELLTEETVGAFALLIDVIIPNGMLSARSAQLSYGRLLKAILSFCDGWLELFRHPERCKELFQTFINDGVEMLCWLCPVLLSVVVTSSTAWSKTSGA